ncbi:hypothetical protein BE11_45620 [Sorangium cellulosum]|nr:hypothetical protein BE11_45620 [Sorangium cellulosum]
MDVCARRDGERDEDARSEQVDGGLCVDEGATVRRALHAGWLAMSVLLGSTAATTSARGEERPASAPSAESARDRAVTDFEEGRRAHLAGRLEEAELSYLRAWSRMKSYDIATNLGQVQILLNKPASAAKHLAFGLRTVGPEVEPERLARVQALLAEAKAQVGTVRVQVTNVADAEVLVGGERVSEEEAKHEMYMDPGQHVLVIRRAGYEAAVIPVTAVAGSREEITTELKPKTMTRPGAAGAPAMMEAKPKAPAAGARAEEPRSWGPVIALGAASAVGLGVAIGLTAASNDARSQADAQRDAILKAHTHCANPPTAAPERCAELRRSVSRAHALGNGARVAYATAGALSIAAVICAAWPRPKPLAAGRVRALPALGPEGGGVVMQATW